MTSVAIASELARGQRALLVDLDFFNRGVTGLFASRVASSPRQKIRAPEGLVSTVDGDDWTVAEVTTNLFCAFVWRC
jgi:Mrp family chromosome partitioning ATPase